METRGRLAGAHISRKSKSLKECNILVGRSNENKSGNIGLMERLWERWVILKGCLHTHCGKRYYIREYVVFFKAFFKSVKITPEECWTISPLWFFLALQQTILSEKHKWGNKFWPWILAQPESRWLCQSKALRTVLWIVKKNCWRSTR